MSYSTTFKVLQVNLNRSAPATESALQVAIELNIDLIVVQEPWITPKEVGKPDYSGTRSILHPSFNQILPADLTLRPRTLVYITKSFRPTVSLAKESPLDPDMLVIDIIEGNYKIQLVNVYNEADQLRTGPRTIDRVLYNYIIPRNTILVGDFNTHHPWWDPLAKMSTEANKLVEWFELNELSLLNTPGTGTFFRPNLSRESVLDLSLVTNSLSNKVIDWQTLPDLGSDHYGLLFTVQGSQTSLVDNPILQSIRYNTKLADWGLFSTSLKSNIVSNPTLSSTTFLGLRSSEALLKPESIALNFLNDQNRNLRAYLDQAAQELTNSIILAANTSIPISKQGPKPKPWWNDNLLALRKTMLRNQRLMHRSSSSKQDYLKAKNTYFLAIKRAKRDHWNQFLTKEDPQSIYKAMSYTKDSQVGTIPNISGESDFKGKCKAFKNTLFPTPPESTKPTWSYRPGNWEWSRLTVVELADACSTKTKGKTPGPDGITQEIIQYAYQAIPDIFLILYSSLLDLGHHPTCWKQATGAILKKPNKPDYSVPKAYRVISLLNCLGKVSERILAKRLSYLAETTSLLHPSQIGGRLQKSAIDAALLLTNEVESNKKRGYKTSSLFLDIKGAFDHVAKNQLLKVLQRLRLPTSLIAWTSSFLDNRTLRLAFDGQSEEFSRVNIGIPQGSPISPILFLIYIRDLFPTLTTKVFSYMDDIALVVASTSLKKNIKILEREAKKLYQLGASSYIQFDLAKTELLHFTAVKGSKTTSLQLPDQVVIQPKELVRWLGIWFDVHTTFKQHVAIRVSQARSAFYRLSRLANTERGLTPFAIRQLYLACITSIADYGSVIWWKGLGLGLVQKQAQLTKPLQALQNLALRKILGVFRTSPIIPMEVEAALYPPSIRLNTSLRNYAIRTQRLALSHPIRLALGEDPGPKTQLGRIWNSIQGLVDLDNLEPIQHFKYPPWKRAIPYSVNISSLPKEEEAIVHTQKLAQLGSDDYIIYSDASLIPNDPEALGIGVGLAGLQYNQESPIVTYQSTTSLGKSQLVYNGELEGITQAVEYASRIARPGLRVQVFSDNKASLLRLRTPSDLPGQSYQIRTSLASEVIVNKGALVSLNWVPGHVDIYGNELADKLAKEATRLDPSIDEVSFALLGQKSRELSTREWLTILEQYSRLPSTNPTSYKLIYPWQPENRLQLPKGTTRELASSYYQLKIGHGYIRSYLYRLGHVQSSICRCGALETAEHLLLSCREPNVVEPRAKLRDELQGTKLSLPLLLHTKIGIEKTLAFLKTTSICTRRRHIQRRYEDVGEE